MLTKNRYSVKEMVLWTRWEIAAFFSLALVVTILYDAFGLTFLNVPWTPVALIGTAVAFMIGFQNNSAYGRIWEARKIWGGIVNASRTWGMKTKDMITNEYAKQPLSQESLKELKKTVIYRHIAWLTTLRHAMRQQRKWEVFNEHHTNLEWSNLVHIPEKIFSLKDDLFHYLSPEEWEYTMGKTNKSAAILFLQSKHLREMKEQGIIWEFSFLDLENILQELFSLQGKSERIKNFPYPRQYATLSYFFVRIFLFLLPFGIIPEFAKIGQSMAHSFPALSPYLVWVGVPFCLAVAWVF